MKIKREAFSECITNVAAKAGVSEDDAFDIIQQVASQGYKLKQTGLVEPYVEAAQRIALQEKIAAQTQRLDALNNALKKNKILLRADTEAGQVTKEGQANPEAIKGVELGLSLANTIRSVVHWVPKAFNNNSIESQWRSLSHAWQGTLAYQLKSGGLDRVARSGELDKEIAEHWWRLNGGKSDASVQISKQAQQIAEYLKPALDLAKDRLNGAGAHIGDALDYVTHTTWDSRQLRLAAGLGKSMDEAFKAWWAKEGPRAADKTFEHLVPEEGETFGQAKERFARSFFDASATGVHKSGPNALGMYDDGDGYVPPAYEGTRNLGKKLSQQRVWYWKDASSWADHMKEFGGGYSLTAQAMNTLDHSARQVGLMEHLGTNAMGNFNNIVRTLQEKYRTDTEAMKAFSKEIEGFGLSPGIRTSLSYLDGSASTIKAGAENLVERFQNIMTVLAAAKLGGVAVPHLASLPMTVSSELAQHGESHLDSIGGVLKAVMTGKGPEEKQQLLSEAGAYAQGFSMWMHSLLDESRGPSGYVSWGATHFMRMTGLPAILDKVHADGIKAVHMTALGNSIDKDFSGFNPQRADMLQRYGIGPKEWDLMRTSGKDAMPVIEGQRYMTPKSASLIDDGGVQSILKDQGIIDSESSPETVQRATQKYKWELADKYLMYLNDSADRSTVTPGVREKSLALQGARPGTSGWMTGRAVAQFKMWPLAAWNQIINREVGNNLSRGGKAANFGWILALGTAAGALRLSVSDFAAGRPQRNFMQPGNLLKALGSGGALGLAGDMLFGEVNRGMQGSLLDFAGPIPADLSEMWDIGNQFKLDVSTDTPTSGKYANENPWEIATKKSWPNVLRLGVGSIPFANLVYLKGALDYMMFYHMYEAASPGWWERSNQRLQKEQQQTMQGYTPGAGVPYGVPGLKALTGIGGV